MTDFQLHNLDCEGAILIDSIHFGDARGGMTKYFEKDMYATNGIGFKLQETFASVSEKNVVRGLHFQIHNPQAKLVCVLCGSVWDVIVDLRPRSKTYRKWVSIELTAENFRCLYIPRGFAHGFLSREDNTVVLYECDGKYDKHTDSGIRYDDPDINIDWPIESTESIHSERDLTLPSYQEYLRHPMEL